MTRRLDELRPHPSYSRHGLAVSASQLSALVELGDVAFLNPIVITRDRFVIDGYALLELARLRGRPTLLCIEFDMNETEGLQWLLWKSRQSNVLNAFSRILLALDLEPGLSEKARSNQRAGGQIKGSSKLTEAESVDIRSKVARDAGVSTGNVTKVKQLTSTANSDVIQALREKELSIHRAWLWSKLSPDEQREKLWEYQSRRGLDKTIRTLISRHQSKTSPTVLNVGDLMRLLSTLQSGKTGFVRVVPISVPWNFVFVAEGLLRTLEAQEELPLTCATNSR